MTTEISTLHDTPVRAARRSSSAIPRGAAAGSGYLLFAWLATLGMARLTGAVPVVIILGATFIGALAALVSGWWRLGRIRSVTVEPSAVSITVDDIVPITVRTIGRGHRPVHATVVDRGDTVAAGWIVGGVLETTGALTRRGVPTQLAVHLSSGGAAGIVWWRRRFVADIEPLVIAPRAGAPGATVEIGADQVGIATDAASSGGRASDGELDGVRRWRDGDADHAVHWPTSLRTGTLSVFDHRRAVDARWVVRADPGVGDRSARDAEAARVRRALDEGRRRGAVVSAAVGDGEPTELPDATAIARWTASCLPDPPTAVDRRWFQRVRRGIAAARSNPAEPVETLSTGARWLVAASSALSLVMLTGALGSSPVTVAALVGGSVLTAAMTTGGTNHRSLKTLVQVLVAAFTVAGLVAITSSVSNADDLLAVIRGPLPQVLMLLVVLHGFECTTRRAARASLAFGAVVAAYAAGQRIDPSLAWWLAIWGIVWVATVRAVGSATVTPTTEPQPGRRPTRPRGRRSNSAPIRRVVASLAAITVGIAATIALLSAVPVPDGPARLGLPASMDTIRRADSPSGIAGADGADTATSGSRDTSARTGSVGGYPGFDHTLDTSMRGDLGDEIVMRVRAPEPDFWRGQTFATFDGRQWRVTEDAGYLQEGPDIQLDPSFGDHDRSRLVPTDEFVQTFYVEVDQPNILFGAYRPDRVVFDGDLYVRSDGALRTDLVLTAGSVYTVVSQRPLVTAAALTRQGLVADRLTPAGLDAFALHLDVPETTTDRTIALADTLAAGATTTYEVVRRMEAWIGEHVQYDLQAPVPPAGVDAVDDLLFGSQLGFCEQIATALAVMLRTQGVPTRLATGYVPGTRDQVTGVWEVRASDAHAWVEVWFPETGWQAFDPTASVPLAGESARASVGGDVLDALSDALDAHGRTIVVIALATLLATLVGTLLGRHLIAAHRRRRRGRWGVIQDRWASAARRRGIDDGCTNPELARRWSTTDPPRAGTARLLAEQLDRAAFEPGWTDDDEAFVRALSLVDDLERPTPRRR